MTSTVLFQKQTELGSIYLEEGTYLGDTRQETETQHGDIYTVLKRPFFCPALPFPILPCAPHLPPLFCQSWSLALSLLSAIAAPPSLEALLLGHDMIMMGDMCAALANLRYALLPPDRLR